MAGVVNALQQTFWEGMYADKVLESLFRENKKWGKRDRSFIAESTYGIVRNWRKLWAILGKDASENATDLYEIFGVWWLLQKRELPEWEEFENLKNFDLENAESNIPQETGIQESFPEWLDGLAFSELESEWKSIASNLNLPAPVAIRVNTLKADLQKVRAEFENQGIEYFEEAEFKNVLFLKKRPNLRLLESYKNGWFEIQDAGSQEIAKFLKPQSGEYMIDACAGAGGKALHAAALMHNQGKIVSMDVYARKLVEHKKRAKRAGVKIIRTEEILNDSSIFRFQAKADKLLLDVPCSGTGVIRREPDTKWKLSEESLTEVISLQKEVLENYSVMVKPGGTLVYATCSILKSENENQVEWFLAKNPEFTLDEEKRINPGSFSDGFYMARLIKN